MNIYDTRPPTIFRTMRNLERTMSTTAGSSGHGSEHDAKDGELVSEASAAAALDLPRFAVGPKAATSDQTAAKKWTPPKGMGVRDANELRETIVYLRQATRLTGVLLFESGVRLARAKERLKHGSWLPYLAHASISPDFAERAMAVAKRISEPTKLVNMTATTLFNLTKKKVPDQVIAAALEVGTNQGAKKVLKEWKATATGEASAKPAAAPASTASLDLQMLKHVEQVLVTTRQLQTLATKKADARLAKTIAQMDELGRQLMAQCASITPGAQRSAEAGSAP